MTAVRRTATGLVAAGVLSLAGAAPSSAAPPFPSGIGTSLCFPVPNYAFPAGGPGYNFVQPPPAAPGAFEQVCGSGPV